MLKNISIAIGVVLTLLILYYLWVIVDARNKTPEIVKEALCDEAVTMKVSDLSTKQLDALLKVQDPNFYYHKGYDFSNNRVGYTTISQAMVKLFYFDHFEPGFQKIEQTIISRFAFDALTPKDSILKLFINYVYLGSIGKERVQGFEHASIAYMGKHFKELDWQEYLAILAMLDAPKTYHYLMHKEENDQRVEKISQLLQSSPLN